jgi:dephospho-CoA kinase
VSKLVGLSGGIASGKSTVAKLLARLGATVIDADAIVRELQAPGTPLLAEIAEAFGPEILDADGALDRDALAGIVFHEAEARARLGDIVHPKVGAEMIRRATAARLARADLVVLDIPLLFEGLTRGGGSAAARLSFDATIVVYAPEETQIQRQLARDGCDREEALRRTRTQLSLEEKRHLADRVIDNSGTLEATERQVRDLYASLTGGK